MKPFAVDQQQREIAAIGPTCDTNGRSGGYAADASFTFPTCRRFENLRIETMLMYPNLAAASFAYEHTILGRRTRRATNCTLAHKIFVDIFGVSESAGTKKYVRVVLQS